MTYARTLGAIDDELTFDVDNGGEDSRAAYVAWAAAVNKYGGTVATAPSSSAQIQKGDAAARYPVDVISPAPTYQLNPLFKRWPDLWTSSGKYGWYRAPAAVLEYTNGHPRSFWDVGTWMSGGNSPITNTQTVPGESPPADPKWYDDIKGMLKSGGWIVGGLVVLSALSFLPRRRD